MKETFKVGKYSNGKKLKVVYKGSFCREEKEYNEIIAENFEIYNEMLEELYEE